MPAAQASLMPAAMPTSCSNPNALGVSRVVEIDTTGGPGFGFEHFKSHDFLREGEVVLTFDDGPWPKNIAGFENIQNENPFSMVSLLLFVAPSAGADFTYQEYTKAPELWKRGFVFGISRYMSAVAQPD